VRTGRLQIVNTCLALLAALPWPVYLERSKAATADVRQAPQQVTGALADTSAERTLRAGERTTYEPIERSSIDGAVAASSGPAQVSRIGDGGSHARSVDESRALQPRHAALCRFLI